MKSPLKIVWTATLLLVTNAELRATHDKPQRQTLFLGLLGNVIKLLNGRGDPFCAGADKTTCSDDPEEYLACYRGETICTKNHDRLRWWSFSGEAACGCCESEPNPPTVCSFV